MPVVAFGCGKIFSFFFNDSAAAVLSRKIVAVADNLASKVGTTVNVSGRTVPVISMDELRNRFPDCILIITTADTYSIFRQLDDDSAFSSTQCCVYSYVLSKTIDAYRSRTYPETFRRTQVPLIPKKIHYCWFGKKPLPERYVAWMNSWEKLCPDYEIIRWDETNYDMAWCPYMEEAYTSMKWGFVSDVARIDVVYRHGGIYLDTDVELIQNLDELLYQQCFFGIDESLRVSTGLGFGAVAGSPVLKGLLDLYAQKHFASTDGKIDITPCPAVQETYFRNLGYMNDGELYEASDFTVYPAEVLAGMSSLTGMLHLSEHTYSIHHYDGSWGDPSRQQKKHLVREQLKDLFLHRDNSNFSYRQNL